VLLGHFAPDKGPANALRVSCAACPAEVNPHAIRVSFTRLLAAHGQELICTARQGPKQVREMRAAFIKQGLARSEPLQLTRRMPDAFSCDDSADTAWVSEARIAPGC
jgi:hypothetical protein